VRLQNLELCFFVIGPFPKCSDFESTLTVASKQGGTAEAVICGSIGAIDSTIKYTFFIVVKQSPWGEIVKESDILTKNLED
jgi:hypothetical protein